MDDELTPEQTERVRRLLAEARHDEPMPGDVAARLDRVLIGLAQDPAATPAPTGDGSGPSTGETGAAPVVRLDERRRRASRLLLAAAAVVVGGVAVGQVVEGGAEEDAASEATSGGAESGSVSGQAEDQGLPAPDRDATGGESDAGARDGAGDEEMPGAVSDTRRSISGQPPARLRSERFTADARSLAPGTTGRRALAQAAPSDALLAGAATCPPGAWGGGRYVRVVLDQEGGWLVYRAPRGDTQVADLFLCETDALERSATLPID